MFISKANLIVSLLAACAVPAAHAFVPGSHTTSRAVSTKLNNDSGGIEEIEFRIYPDGRITEVVRGVKGKNCEEVTAAINKQL